MSMRDLELPMSPIEKPSVLELADTSVISLDNSFYRPPLNTASIPRVSTMKLPRGPAANQRVLKLHTCTCGKIYRLLLYIVFYLHGAPKSFMHLNL